MDNQDSSSALTLTDTDTPADASLPSTTDTPQGADASTRVNSAARKRPTSPTPPVAPERVGQNYRLTQTHDWGIRYAALMLETQDGQRRTQQDLVDQAVRELLERLKKKGMTFPDHLAI
ncbi:hypothetical protein [Hymenobacter sp. DG01]|uniref:hypothetical protein n=1 Tax=Hymenobacter sp. DG01 TaxID=2584940 RepID=UPI00111E4DE7|nr:hypothetical protein [Hymenobacter sp. DG01]